MEPIEVKPMSRLALLAIVILVAACAGKAASHAGSPPAAVPSASETGAAEPGQAEASAERIVALRSSIIPTHYRARDWRACADAFAELDELGAMNNEYDLYTGACCFALAGDADGALTWLERSAALGLRDAEHVRGDGDLVTLHEHPRWPAVVAKLQANLDEYLTTVNREL